MEVTGWRKIEKQEKEDWTKAKAKINQFTFFSVCDYVIRFDNNYKIEKACVI